MDLLLLDMTQSKDYWMKSEQMKLWNWPKKIGQDISDFGVSSNAENAKWFLIQIKARAAIH